MVVTDLQHFDFIKSKLYFTNWSKISQVLIPTLYQKCVERVRVLISTNVDVCTTTDYRTSRMSEFHSCNNAFY